MSLTQKLKLGFISFGLLCVAVLTLPASAEECPQKTDIQSQVGDRLGEFRSTAFQLYRQADYLQSHRNSALSWQSHAARLTTLKHHVNELGKSLSELEELKPQANDTQRLAIEHARPHLVAVAESTSRAIQLLNENRAVIRFPEYREVAGDIHEHADTLRTKLDAILDFESSKARMNALEIQSMSSEGS